MSSWPGWTAPDRKLRRFFTRQLSIATSATLSCGQSFAGGVSAANSGELVGAHTREFRKAWTAVKSNLEPTPQQTDQCFTIINYGTDFVLKLYRKMEEGINPGREVPEFLCEHTTFKSLPAALGSLEYHRYLEELNGADLRGHAQRAVPNANAGWHYTVDQLGLFFEHTLAIPQDDPRVSRPGAAEPVGARPIPRRLSSANCWAITWTAFAVWRAVPPRCTSLSAASPTFPILPLSPSPRSIARAYITACWAS